MVANSETPVTFQILWQGLHLFASRKALLEKEENDLNLYFSSSTKKDGPQQNEVSCGRTGCRKKKSFFSIPLSPSNSENLVGYYLLQQPNLLNILGQLSFTLSLPWWRWSLAILLEEKILSLHFFQAANSLVCT